jgi:hypothetical protein
MVTNTAFPSFLRIKKKKNKDGLRSPRHVCAPPRLLIHPLPSLNPSPQLAIDDPFPLTDSALRVMEPSSYVAAAELERSPSPPAAFQPVPLGYNVVVDAADERREMDFFKREKRERSEGGVGNERAATMNDLRIMKDDLTINVRRR